MSPKLKFIFKKRHALTLVLHLKNATGMTIQQISFIITGNPIQNSQGEPPV